jgi:bifunctional non-homologous end joining protein LigD
LSDHLEAYRRKRDPNRTPEPFGGEVRPGGRRFVVHMHAATHLHYDLRLELLGVLKSWAVPKGPSTKVEEKRLAVHVEDHPLEYGDFEGNIPAGNYGAGSVIIWDHGWFRSFKPEDLVEQYQRGKLELELFGFKLRGRWTLVKMSKLEKEWLLLKKAGAGSSDRELVDRYPESVVSGLTVEERRDPEAKLAALSVHLESLGAPRRDVPARGQKLMLATLEEKPFDGEDWLFEIKYDGVRVIARRKGEAVEMLGRNGNDITARYPEIAKALASLPCDDFVLDGEVIAPDDSGQPSFQRLQARMLLTKPRDVAAAMAETPVNAVFFDALAIQGLDLRRVPLIERKQGLKQILPPLGTVRFGDHVAEHGTRFFEACSEMRLEGIVAKRAQSFYTGARGRDWVKIKCQRRQEFVVGGWTDPQGARGGFGSLDVGLYRDGKLVYVTRVGGGFDEELLDSIKSRLDALARTTSPFEERSPKGRDHHWVEPRLVCEVRFTEWTRDGGLRHPIFVGLREDKAPEECVFEEESAAAVREEASESDVSDAGVASRDAGADDRKPVGSVRRDKTPRDRAPSATTAPKAATAGRATLFPQADRVVRPTNLDKIFWPEDGYTKGDLIGYYEKIATLMLPYLAERPIFVTRYPDGIHGKSFYQKDAPVFVPEWIHTESIYSEGNDQPIRYFVLDDVEMLRYVINMGTIPIHPWSSRIGNLEKPDWMILDLDPKGAPFEHVIRVAHTVKQLLDELEIDSFVKTSGATGLHVLVPLGARYTYEQSRTFARVLATIVVDREPEISTIVRAVHARGGKVYVDFGQNGYGQTIVAPFCVRPVPGASVSCPLDWDEVTPKLSPAKFTIATVPKRFAKREDPLRGLLGEGIRIEEAVKRLEGRMGGRP